MSGAPERPAGVRDRPRLPDERIRSRISAYVYGDVLVLAAVLELGPDRSWSSVLALVATTATTYVAHVVAHAIGERVGRTEAETAGHLRAELRDAVPIGVAGLVPALAVALAALGVLQAEAAQVIGAAVVVLRLAATGAVTGRLTGASAPLPTLLSGIAIAVVGAVIAVLKVALPH